MNLQYLRELYDQADPERIAGSVLKSHDDGKLNSLELITAVASMADAQRKILRAVPTLITIAEVGQKALPWIGEGDGNIASWRDEINAITKELTDALESLDALGEI